MSGLTPMGSEPSREPSEQPEPPEESGAYPVGTVVVSLERLVPTGIANCGTSYGAFELLPSAPADFRALFLAVYPDLRHLARSRAEVGVAAFAVDRLTGKLVGSMAVAARPGRVVGAIVGRHEQADLFLDTDPGLANRQLAVLLHPLTSWEPDRVRYRVIDLRTRQPMVGEDDRPVASVEVEGPFIARVGRHALFFLPTGEPTDFPERGEDAWAALPERITLERQELGPGAWTEDAARRLAQQALAKARGRSSDRCSVVTADLPMLGPEETLCGASEEPAGQLTIRTPSGLITYPVGARALHRGILLGRYPRCDGSSRLAYETISRAHLLLARVGGRLVALDTASTNGTLLLHPTLRASGAGAQLDGVLPDGYVRAVSVVDDTHLLLAGIVEVVWRDAG